MVEPIKIVKYRKIAYPLIRDNYRRYKNATWKWEDVFVEIDDLKNNNSADYIKVVSQSRNIKYSTLKRKYSEWIDNNKNIDKDDRGGNNKIFTESEERELYNYIVNVFIDCNLAFSNEHLKLLAIQKYHMLKKEKDKNYVEDTKFTLSDGWVSDFKKRWKLSSLKTKLSRKGTKIIASDLDSFLKECKLASETIDSKYIFNLDETFWRICTSNITVIGLTNSDHRKVDTLIDEKSGFTALFIISYAGEFMTPYIILKGTTKRSLTKIKDISDDDVTKKYSYSGWISTDIMSEILENISMQIKINVS